MKSQRLPISVDEFRRLPYRLGWKHEYYGDHAHITPQHSAIVVATLPVQKRPAHFPCPLRPTGPEDVPALFPTYLAAFQDTIDYCDWALDRIERAARQNLTSFFAGQRGRALPASRVAVHDEEIVGAALLVEKPDARALLDLLFVAPAWQRRGLATALVAAALNALEGTGFTKLSSRYMLGNEQSRRWHQRFGFVDEPNLFVARAYYYHAQHELTRQQELGALSADELAALVTEHDARRQQLDELHEIEQQHGLRAVYPRFD